MLLSAFIQFVAFHRFVFAMEKKKSGGHKELTCRFSNGPAKSESIFSIGL